MQRAAPVTRRCDAQQGVTAVPRHPQFVRPSTGGPAGDHGGVSVVHSTAWGGGSGP